MSHPIQREAALKGKLRVDRIRVEHASEGWTCDNRHVNARGVDLVCFKKQAANDPKAVWIDGEFTSELVKVYEITNWSKDSWMSTDRCKNIIFNLNEEAGRQKAMHPKAHVLKILVVSYRENIEHVTSIVKVNGVLTDVWLANGIEIEELGYDEPLSDSSIDAWTE